MPGTLPRDKQARCRRGGAVAALAVLAAGALPTVLDDSAARAQPPAAAPPRVLNALDTSEPITYFIADGEDGSGFRASDRELAQWALEAWQRAGRGAFVLEPAREAEALLRIYWVPPGYGQYGEMRPLTVGGRRGAAVYVRPDTDALGPEIAVGARQDPLLRDTVVYLTCVHELGHAFGLEHTDRFDDIMYFFGFGGDIGEFFGRYRRQLRTREDIAGLPGISAGDLTLLAALYDD